MSPSDGVDDEMVMMDQMTPLPRGGSAIDSTIDQLGWRSGTHVERPHGEVAVYMVDVLPESDMVFRPEGPATFSLSIFLDGAGTLSVDGAVPLDIRRGLAVLFACNRTTRGENHIHVGRRLRFVDIRFELPLLEKLGGVSLARMGGAVMTEHGKPEQDVFLIGFTAPQDLLSVASSLLRCQFETGPPRSLYFYSKAIEALSLGLDAIGKIASNRPLRPLNAEERRKLEAAVECIKGQYSIDWTTARLAREVGLNERRLKEGFRLAMGKSVHAYLRATRLDAAAAFLISGVSVTDTAYAVGFDNLSHFSKIFREAKGILPSLYARQ